MSILSSLSTALFKELVSKREAQSTDQKWYANVFPFPCDTGDQTQSLEHMKQAPYLWTGWCLGNKKGDWGRIETKLDCKDDIHTKKKVFWKKTKKQDLPGTSEPN